MRKQLFLFFICAVVCTSLHCMDSNSDHVIKEIVIYHMDKDTHRTFAMLNKAYNKIIEDNYRPDKKRIEQLMLARKTPIIRGHVSWNKDFNQCAWATVVERAHIFAPKRLVITLLGFNDQKRLEIRSGVWSGYMKPAVGDTLSVFFNKYGAACCHGYGQDDLLEYSLKRNGQAEKKQCVVRANDRGVECALKEVLHIPAVMKAFLESPYVYDSAAFGEIIKLYHLSKVIMPEEYKKYADPQYWINCAELSSYHDDCSGYSNF